RHKSNLSSRDLRVDSPYNTYLHYGLPPGSICNPGKSALSSVFNPAKSEFIFFLNMETSIEGDSSNEKTILFLNHAMPFKTKTYGWSHSAVPSDHLPRKEGGVQYYSLAEIKDQAGNGNRDPSDILYSGILLTRNGTGFINYLVDASDKRYIAFENALKSIKGVEIENNIFNKDNLYSRQKLEVAGEAGLRADIFAKEDLEEIGTDAQARTIRILVPKEIFERARISGDWQELDEYMRNIWRQVDLVIEKFALQSGRIELVNSQDYEKSGKVSANLYPVSYPSSSARASSPAQQTPPAAGQAESSLPPYTGAGDTSIHAALDDAKAKIEQGDLAGAEKLLNELRTDLITAQQSGSIEALMDNKWNQRYPSDLPVDLLFDGIPAALSQIDSLLVQITKTSPAQPGTGQTPPAASSPVSVSPKVKAARQKVDEIINDIKKKIPVYDPTVKDVEKALESGRGDYTANAELFQKEADSQGLGSEIVRAVFILGSLTGAHMFNVVSLPDGQRLAVDLTGFLLKGLDRGCVFDLGEDDYGMIIDGMMSIIEPLQGFGLSNEEKRIVMMEWIKSIVKIDKIYGEKLWRMAEKEGKNVAPQYVDALKAWCLQKLGFYPENIKTLNLKQMDSVGTNEQVARSGKNIVIAQELVEKCVSGQLLGSFVAKSYPEDEGALNNWVEERVEEAIKITEEIKASLARTKNEYSPEPDTFDEGVVPTANNTAFKQYLYIPEPLPGESDIEYELRAGEEFIRQFGSKSAVWDSSIRNEDVIGITDQGDSKNPHRCGIGKRGAGYPREVRIRIAAHEVEHSWYYDHFNSLETRLSALPEYQDLQRRVGEAYDRANRPALLKHKKSHYQSPSEIQSLLRAYQVSLQQGESGEQGEYFEFLEVFAPQDLIWLDRDRLRNIMNQPEPPASGEKVIIQPKPDKGEVDGSAGSPSISQASKTPGGIDFRGLPIVTQAMPGLSGDPSLRSGLPAVAVPAVELDKEWQQIQNMVNAGIIPSVERIKDYLQACCQREDAGSQIDKVLSCIADILRLEEEQVIPTDKALRDLLVLLESDKPAQEIPFAVSNITVLPKEPRVLKQ
ncbi:MAG: endolytic transglycosylase MltG, partial [Candidatus Omnitrophica bacterium]|nr:endolytic transglycosylase MltG [Candidatus Omnitrophota bacterium]